MRGLIAAALAILVLGAGTAYAVMEPVELIGVSRDALASSLDDTLEKSDAGYAADTRCVPPATGEMWRCSTLTDYSGSSRSYLVSVDDEGCWEAGEMRPRKDPTGDSSTAGCIGFLNATGLSAD